MEPSRELRRSHCDQANLQASTLYSQRPRGRREGCQNLLTSAGHMTAGGPEYPPAADSILDRWWPSQEHTAVLPEPQIP